MAPKRALETAEQIHDAHQHVAAWCAALGSLAVGAVLLYAPAGVLEQVPSARWIGTGFATFGAAFLLALLARGRAAVRAKALLLVLVMAALSAGTGWISFQEARLVLALRSVGVEHTLPVASSKPHRRGEERFFRLEFIDGTRRLQLESKGPVAPGTPMTILAHPERGDWTAAVGRDATFFEILDARRMRRMWLVTTCIAVGAALTCLAACRTLLLGRE